MKTAIKLHGILGEQMKKTDWSLKVSSVGEAMRAIEIISKRKFFKQLLDNDKKNIKYRVLINGRDFETEKPLTDINDIENIKSSELNMNFKELKSIDVIPILEGAGSQGGTLAIILGVVLIVVGILLIETPIGGYLIVAGIGLIAAGVTALLTKPPNFEDFRKLQDGGRPSYLFSGPQNTTREGGPVPVGYGRLLVGSQVLSASYEISHVNADSNPLTS